MKPSLLKRLQDRLIPITVERFISEYSVRVLGGILNLAGSDLLLNRPARQINVERDIEYGGADRRCLDILTPSPPVLGTVMYFHGGGFRLLSKETHYYLAKLLASNGFRVLNIDYARAPESPYPAPLRDAVAALTWYKNAAPRRGFGEPLHLAGESAGANIALALGMMTAVPCDEPWAMRAYETPVSPATVTSICGLLQVSDPSRLDPDHKLSPWIRDRLLESAQDYLPATWLNAGETPMLADPLRLLESLQVSDDNMPFVFAVAGTDDPVRDDVERLQSVFEAGKILGETRLYADAGHAFHSLLWQSAARQFWRDWFDFLESYSS
jgi:acetyl esterase